MTRNGLTSNGPQLITQPSSLLDYLPPAGPQYEVSYDAFGDQPVLSYEEENHKVFNHKLSTLNSHKEPANTTTSKAKSLPKRSCIVMGSTQYSLDPDLLSFPHMDHFFVKERSEVKPGCFLAKLVLQHQYHDKARYALASSLMYSYGYCSNTNQSFIGLRGRMMEQLQQQMCRDHKQQPILLTQQLLKMKL